MFAAILSPLIVASRSRDFADAGRAKDQLIAWVMSLADVSRPILEAGVERLVAAGVTWMPRPGDLRQACCEVVDARRAAAARQARALTQDCSECQQSPGWRETATGVVPCTCRTLELQLMAQAEAPLARPALPAASEDAYE